MSTFIESATDLARKATEGKDTEIRKQLSWLLSRGLLEVREKEGKFLRMENSGQLVYQQEIELKLKDAEYIEKLEAELVELRKFKQRIQSAIKD